MNFLQTVLLARKVHRMTALLKLAAVADPPQDAAGNS